MGADGMQEYKKRNSVQTLYMCPKVCIINQEDKEGVQIIRLVEVTQ